MAFPQLWRWWSKKSQQQSHRRRWPWGRWRWRPLVEQLEERLVPSTVPEIEPNNTLLQATALSLTNDPPNFLSGLGQGAISPANDADFWRFDAEAGDHITAAVESDGSLPTVSLRNAANPYVGFGVPELWAWFKGRNIHDVGAHYEYSNLGVGVLGQGLAERLQGQYEDVLRARILAPLGLDDTRIALTPEMAARLAQPHDEKGKPVPAWDLPAFAGAGAPGSQRACQGGNDGAPREAGNNPRLELQPQ